MRLILLIVFAALTTGCETAPPTIEYTFAEFEPLEEEVTYPSELSDLAPLECYPSEEDCRVAGYTSSTDVDRLEIYKARAEGNTTIAAANADIINIFIAREEAILAAAESQETITALREEQLAWERTERRREKWYYRVMLGLVIGAGVYASGN